jgi:hypothetical protein
VDGREKYSVLFVNNKKENNMYAVISDQAGVLGRFNDEKSAIMNAQDWAILRGESLYVYFRNQFYAEV